MFHQDLTLDIKQRKDKLRISEKYYVFVVFVQFYTKWLVPESMGFN